MPTTASQIPLFLINLDRSPDRLAAFRDQMEGLELTFERVAAVDGCDIPEEEVHRLLQNKSHLFSLKRGEMGCFLSHRKVWNIIVERKLNWAFIAEDDVHIANAFPFFSNANWIPNDANVVKAETLRQRVFMSRGLSQKLFDHRLRRLKSGHLGTGGYFLNATTAQFLMSATESVCDPVDQLLFNPLLGLFQQMTVYQIDPAICVQDFLLENAQQEKRFVSTLQGERDAAVRPAEISPKPIGWAKFRRETRRVSNRLKIFLSGNTSKRVPFINDRRRSEKVFQSIARR